MRRVGSVALLAMSVALGGCPGGAVDRPPDVGGTGRVGGGAGGAAGREVLRLACGDFHTCAIMKDRTVRCWGRNKSGELGDGTDTDQVRPTPVKNLADVEELALGANFSCARLADKTVKCWGSGRLFNDGRMGVNWATLKFRLSWIRTTKRFTSSTVVWV